jgi:hypothetical protein
VVADAEEDNKWIPSDPRPVLLARRSRLGPDRQSQSVCRFQCVRSLWRKRTRTSSFILFMYNRVASAFQISTSLDSFAHEFSAVSCERSQLYACHVGVEGRNVGGWEKGYEHAEEGAVPDARTTSILCSVPQGRPLRQMTNTLSTRAKAEIAM